MYEAKTFALPDATKTEQNVTHLLDWIVPPLYKKLEDKIGWLNLDTKYWFGTREAGQLIDRIKELCPALGVEEDFGLLASMTKRFYNNARDRKIELGIAKTKGKLL